MKCDSCIHAYDCMHFFCNEETRYKDYKEAPPQEWQIEKMTVQYNVICDQKRG